VTSAHRVSKQPQGFAALSNNSNFHTFNPGGSNCLGGNPAENGTFLPRSVRSGRMWKHRDEPKETNRRLSTSIDVKWSLSLRYQIPIVVRSSFSDVKGQVIRKRTDSSKPSLVGVIRKRTISSTASTHQVIRKRTVYSQLSVDRVIRNITDSSQPTLDQVIRKERTFPNRDCNVRVSSALVTSFRT